MTLELNADEGAQALDLNQLFKLLAGFGVRTNIGGGCAVSAASGMDVTVADGEIIFDGSTVSVGSQTVTIPTSDSTYPRKDIVYLDGNGTAQVATGSAAEALPSGKTKRNTYQPMPPDLSATDAVVLAEVWVDAGTSSIGNGDISDRRLDSNTNLNTVSVTEMTITDLVAIASGGVLDANDGRFKFPSVASASDLPSTSNEVGETIYVENEDRYYTYE